MPDHEQFFTWPHTSAETLLIYNHQNWWKGSQVKGATCQFSFFTLCRFKGPSNFILIYTLLPSWPPLTAGTRTTRRGVRNMKLLPLEPLSFLLHCLCCFSPLSPILVFSPSSQLYPLFRYHWKSLLLLPVSWTTFPRAMTLNMVV